MQVKKQEIRVEYMCTWCGKRVIKDKRFGRPMPGICPLRSTAERKRPHVWVSNRQL